jgi:hypothetical protein
MLWGKGGSAISIFRWAAAMVQSQSALHPTKGHFNSARNKSFLLLFFKKEVLAFFSSMAAAETH